MLFQTIAIMGIGATAAACLAHWLVAGRKARRFTGPRAVRRYTAWERLVHLALTVGLLAAAVTAFIPAIQGMELRGYLLLLHVAISPIFAVALVPAALRWAEDCRFRKYDRLRCRGGNAPAGKFEASQKLLFWACLLLGLTTVLSAVLQMFSLFGPEGIGALLEVHRYSALLLLMAVMIHSYMTTLAKPGSWQAMVSGKVGADWARHHYPIWAEGSKVEETRQ